MPFKSKAQQRKFFAMEARGELPKGKALEWAHETPDIKALPEKVGCGDMIQYFSDHPDKLREKKERDRKKTAAGGVTRLRQIIENAGVPIMPMGNNIPHARAYYVPKWMSHARDAALAGGDPEQIAAMKDMHPGAIHMRGGRLEDAADVPVAAHEFGHAVADRTSPVIERALDAGRLISNRNTAPLLGFGAGVATSDEKAKERSIPKVLGGVAAAGAPLAGTEGRAWYYGSAPMREVAPSRMGEWHGLNARNTALQAGEVAMNAGIGYGAGRTLRHIVDSNRKKEKTSNFKLHGERMFKGLDIAIENRKGSKRSWYDPHGKEKGSTHMHFDYGYIRMTKGTDGDHVDVYLGPNEESDKVFLVDQMKKPPGEIKKDGVEWKVFDEQKIMLGFDSAGEAKAAYMKQYNDPRFFGSMKEMPFEEFKMKVLDKDNHGQKIALAISPTVISHLGHAGVGAGIGAVAGGVGGMLHADPGQRQQGAMRGALVGAGLGAAGGAGISALKQQGAHQLGTLRAQAGQAELAAREAHQVAGKTIADPALAGTMHAAGPGAVGPGTMAARPGAAGGAGGAPGITLNTQQKAVMTPTAWGGSSTPAAPMNHAVAQSVAASRGGQAEALRQAAGRLEQQHNVVNQGLNRAGLVGAAAGTGLMGYMAVPHQYGGVGPMPGKTASEKIAVSKDWIRKTIRGAKATKDRALDSELRHSDAWWEMAKSPAADKRREAMLSAQDLAESKKASEDPRTSRIADRIDDVGIATLASPYLADAAAGGLKRLMLRGGRMGALAAEGHTVAEGLAHALHHPAVELGGLGLVAPGITHALAKPIAKVTAPKLQEPIVAGQSDMIGNQGTLKAASELGRALANPSYQIKHSGYGRLALGLGAVGAVGAGLVGAKKGVDAVHGLATSQPTPMRYVGVQPGMRPPSPAGM